MTKALPRMTNAQALKRALKALDQLYDARWASEDEGDGHIWGDMATWEIRSEVEDALRAEFQAKKPAAPKQGGADNA